MRIAGTVCLASAVAVLLVTLGLAYRDAKAGDGAQLEARQTRQILDRTAGILSLMKDAEIAQRGFLLTGDSAQLAPLLRAESILGRQLDDLHQAAAGQPGQQARIDRLRPALRQEFAALNATVELRKQEGLDAALEANRTSRGATAMAETRGIGSEIARSATSGLASETLAAEGLRRRMRTLTAAGSAVFFCLLLAAGFDISRASARSRELRNLLHTTLTSIREGVIATNAEGTVTFLNPAAQQLTGWAGTEALGQPLDTVFQLASESTGAGMKSTAMLRSMLRSRDGSLFPVDESASPILARDGANLGVALVFRDLTARRKAEQAEIDLASIVEYSDDAIIGKRLDGTITSWNAAATRIFGYSAEEMIGSSVDRLMPDSRANDVAEILERIRRGERVLHYETVRRRKDGVEIAVALTISPILDASGRVVGASEIARDISGREQAQEALRESEERFRRLFESNLVGLAFWDSKHLITQANDAYLSIIGYTRQEFAPGMIGWRDLTPPEYQGLDDLALREAATHSISRLYEKEYVRRDGKRIPIAIGVADLKNSRREGLAFVLDISERKRLQEQLLRSQKLESLSVLAGGIAHDFNNLLMGILANATLMRDETAPGSPLAGLIDNIFTATGQAAQLTRQMLAYSGKGAFAVVPMSIAESVGDIASLLRASLPVAVDLRLNLAPDLPAIEGDSGQIGQLIGNLALNGAEAIESQGVVTISTFLREVAAADATQNLAGPPLPPGAYVLLEVHDTGIGMDEATLAKMFDPFFSTKFTGRGLGLAAVLGIVRAHHGGISVWSAPQKGTTFQVFLPVEQESACSVPAAEPQVLHAKM